MKEFKSALLGESCKYFTTDAGLKVYVCEKKDFSSCHAMLGTAYGSVNNEFCLEGEEMTAVPAGIAHFLEHKLFESEQGDAFSLFSATGAEANAFTSFDRTVYLFSCTNNFEENLSILLNFVTHPYFSEQTVAKEQGIIGQEIQMYLDDPSWRVFFNTLCAMYQINPVKEDIAGSVDSISRITPELLYRCYNTFYRPSNMFLCVAGNVDAEKVFSLAEAAFPKKDSKKIINAAAKKETAVAKSSITESGSVAIPLFCFGIKFPDPFSTYPASIAAASVAAELLFGKSSPVFKKLFDLGLINTKFYSEYFFGKDHSSIILNGESSDTDAVETVLREYISRLDDSIYDDFELAKKAVIGRNLVDFNEVGDIASLLTDAAIYFEDPFSYFEKLNSLSPADVRNVIKNILPENAVFSRIVSK